MLKWGCEKPDTAYFQLVIEGLQNEMIDLEPENIVYSDDSHGNIEAARQLGIDAHVYESVEQVEKFLG